jgi:hypothetical protein
VFLTKQPQRWTRCGFLASDLTTIVGHDACPTS